MGACWDMVGERVCQWWQYTRYIHSFKGMRYHFQLLFSSVFLKKCSSTLKTHVSCTRSVGTAMVWNVCCMGAGGCKRAQQTRVLRLLHPLTTSTKIRGKGEGGGRASQKLLPVERRMEKTCTRRRSVSTTADMYVCSTSWKFQAVRRSTPSSKATSNRPHHNNNNIKLTKRLCVANFLWNFSSVNFKLESSY